MYLFSCTDPGSVGKTDSTLSQRREEGHPTIDLSKQGKPVGKSSASKTRKKKYKILGAEVSFLNINNKVNLCFMYYLCRKNDAILGWSVKLTKV
jgi:hypothetical protein